MEIWCLLVFPQASFHVGSKKDNLQEVPCYSWEVGILDLKGLNNKIFGCFISLFGEVVKHLGYFGRSF